MSTICFERSHALSWSEARRRAENLAEAIERKLGVSWRWEDDATMRLQAAKGPAKGTTGRVDLHQGRIRISIQLPLLFRAMKSVVEQRLQRKLDKVLAVTPVPAPRSSRPLSAT